MSCFLRLPATLKSNFMALFSSRNRLRTLINTILLLDGRCHIGHKNANRLHAQGSACALVAGTQDVALMSQFLRLKLYAALTRLPDRSGCSDGWIWNKMDWWLKSENIRNSCSVATSVQVSYEVTHYKKKPKSGCLSTVRCLRTLQHTHRNLKKWYARFGW